jgi:hypothetical protein
LKTLELGNVKVDPLLLQAYGFNMILRNFGLEQDEKYDDISLSARRGRKRTISTMP